MNRKLRHARLRRGWSQQEAADAANVTLRTYQRWESEQYHPNFASRRLLHNAFGCSDEELGFDLTDTEQQAHDPDLQTATDDGEQLLRLTAEQVALLKRILEEQNMAIFDETRRKTLQQIAVALGMTVTATHSIVDPEPWERLASAASKPSVLNHTALERFESLIGEGWALSNANELEAAEGVVGSFLPKMLAIPRYDVTPQLAFLASQGLRLQSVLVHHRLRLDEKLALCQQSVIYARAANDPNTLVPALIEYACAYEYKGDIEQSLYLLQEALYYSGQASPLVKSRTYSKNAAILAQVGRQKEAEFYSQLARETFPTDPSLDPSYKLADSSVFTLSYHTGRTYLALGKLAAASDGFDLYKDHPSGAAIPERLRLEIVNGQSQLAIQMHELEYYASLFEDVITSATALGSQKRYGEALRIFEQDVPRTWLKDSAIKRLMLQYDVKRKR